MSSSMVRSVARPVFTALLFILVLATPLLAQYQDLGTLMRAGKSDARTLLQEYLKPVGIAFGGNLNNGWYRRAGTHQPFGVGLTIDAIVTHIPAAGRMIDMQSLDLEYITCIDSRSNAIPCPDSPTLVGPDEPGALIGSTETVEDPRTGQRHRLFEATLPPGSGIPYVPSPMIQASMGLPWHTDIAIRFLPPVSVGGARTKLAGIGVKHQINRWLPAGGMLPLDLSLQTGYTRMVTTVDMDVRPETDSQTQNPYEASHWDNQRAEFKSNAVVINALAGKNFVLFSLFAGLGYQFSATTLSTPGSYPAIARNPGFDPSEPQGPGNLPKIVDSLEEPVDLKFRNKGSLRATAGFSLQFWVVNLNGAFTYSRYPVFRAGLGVSIR